MSSTRFLAVFAGATLAAGAAAAQDMPWRYDAVVYGWVPAMDTTTETRFGDVGSSGSGSDALSALDMAFMGTFEARRGKWGLIGDLIYADLSNSEASPRGIAFEDAEVDVKMLAFSGYAAYRAYETPAVSVDLLGGFRAFDLSVDTRLNAATDAVPDRDFTQSSSWIDPLLGARVSAPLGEKWVVTAAADAGGFVTGSSATWQALGTVGYRFAENWAVRFGYRFMSVEKEIDGRDVEVDLSGPVLGVAVRF